MAKSYKQEDFAELKNQFSEAVEYEEGYDFILLPKLILLQDVSVDGLLCPQPREGYLSRLFFSKQLPLKEVKPWGQFYIMDKSWYAVSWQPPTSLRLIQMVGNHLKALNV
jgi:hypothetical protein